MKFNDAVILAAGVGHRMLPLTANVPKPLVEIDNAPLINYSIDFLKNNGIENIFVTYGYKGNLLLEKIHKNVNGFINTEEKGNAYFLFESPIKYIDKPIIVCPSDIIVEIDLQKIYFEYEKLGSPPACIVPASKELDADSLKLEGNIVLGISRREKSGKYASGVQILNPKQINKLISKKSNFYEVWSALIDKKLLYCTDSMPTAWEVFDRLSDIEHFHRVKLNK